MTNGTFDLAAAYEMLLQAYKDERVRVLDMQRDAVLRGALEDEQRSVAEGAALAEEYRQIQDLYLAHRRRGEPPAGAATTAAAAVDPIGPGGVTGHTCTPLPQRWLDGAGGAAPQARRTRRRVEKTPNREYRLPILESLNEMGGRAPSQRVLDLVFEKMRPRLTPDDLQQLDVSPVKRWWKTANFERLAMVTEGLLASSAHGWWEITEDGRAYLARVKAASAQRDSLDAA